MEIFSIISDSDFRTVLGRARIELSAGQLTHVLRHTFASHFEMNDDNIWMLQKNSVIPI